jgi:hypothetical protein
MHTNAPVSDRLLVYSSRTAGIAMAFKFIESAQRRWRAVNAPHLIALASPRQRPVREGQDRGTATLTYSAASRGNR